MAKKVTQALATAPRVPSLETTLNILENISSKIRPREVRPKCGMIYGQEIKSVTWEFDPKKFPTLEILHLTDTQMGHRGCQLDRVEEYRDWVLSRPNRFLVFGGDMVDAGTKISVGDPHEQSGTPLQQVIDFCNVMAPVAHRVLGYVGGNHERRSELTFGNLGLMIANFLRIPVSLGRQFVNIEYGSHRPFRIDLWHGRGAARTKGAKVMMLWNYVMEHPGSDLYLCGHLHDCFLLPFHKEHHIRGKNEIRITKHYAGMSSSFLNTWGTYAEVAGMSLTDVLMLRCILEPSGKSEVTVR